MSLVRTTSALSKMGYFLTKAEGVGVGAFSPLLILKLRSPDSSCPFFLSDNSTSGQWTQMFQMLWSQGWNRIQETAPKKFLSNPPEGCIEPLKRFYRTPQKGYIEPPFGPKKASIESWWEGRQNHRQGSIEPFASNPPLLCYPLKILPKGFQGIELT